MRLVIYNGAQYDADNLPANVPADKCVPIDEWFAKNKVVKTQPKPARPAPEAEVKADEPVKPRKK